MDHRLEGNEMEDYFEMLSSAALEQLNNYRSPEWMTKHLTDHVDMVLNSAGFKTPDGGSKKPPT